MAAVAAAACAATTVASATDAAAAAVIVAAAVTAAAAVVVAAASGPCVWGRRPTVADVVGLRWSRRPDLIRTTPDVKEIRKREGREGHRGG